MVIKMNRFLYKFLSWKYPIFIRNIVIGIIYLLKPKEYSQFYQDNTSKEYWYSCAHLLCKVGYKNNKDILEIMFKWLQDVNWPGSNEIFYYLVTVDKTVFMEYYQKAIVQAISDNDDIWIENLAYFVVERGLKLSDFTNRRIYELLVKSQT
jgi:hypothetical protein